MAEVARSHARSATRYPPCDSYFVEDDDALVDGMYQTRNYKEDPWAAQQVQEDKALQLSNLTKEYLPEVLSHMEFMESITLPDVASIELQTEIQWFMRPYLLDFLIEAHLAFGLLPETLFLTVNILDRYCSKRVVYKRHYQLVGCTSLLIAAKYGDKKDRVPALHELKLMCCSLYDEDMFVQMEWHVLETLKWVIGHPTVDSFLQLSLPCLNYSRDEQKTKSMAKYILEIALFHKEFLGTRPSIMARTSLALARHVLNVPDVPPQEPALQEWSKEIDTGVLVNLSQFLTQPSTVLYRKYSASQFDGVAVALEQFMQRQVAALARQQPFIHPATPPSLQYEYGDEPYTPRSEYDATDDEGDSDSNGTAPERHHQEQQYTPVKNQNVTAVQNQGLGVVTPPKTPEEYLAIQQQQCMQQQQQVVGNQYLAADGMHGHGHGRSAHPGWYSETGRV